MSDVAQNKRRFGCPDGTGVAFTGSYCPPIVWTFTAQSLDEVRGLVTG